MRRFLMRGTRPVCRALMFATLSVACWLSIPEHRSALRAQPMAPAAASPVVLPEAIFWKQHLFLIPYQWGSAAQPGAARVVWLFVSKDRGITWQKISEAKPDVRRLITGRKAMASIGSPFARSISRAAHGPKDRTNPSCV